MPDPVVRPGIGAAVDLGTTTLVVRVYDLTTGQILHRAEMLNPQTRISADVLGRISAAQEGRLPDLCQLVRDAIRDCLGGLAIDEAVVVGNTTMLCLLAGHDPSSFATAPFAADRLFGETLEIERVRVRLPRCAHAFFGADAVASVRMANLCEEKGVALLADVGTNGELALWRGDRRELIVSSVAAGPAFERSGLVGSELIAAIADGLASGAVDETGLVCGKMSSGVTQADIRAVQLAKAAVCAGLRTLLRAAETSLGEVSVFSLVGGFGSAIDPVKAARIGLFPNELLPVVRMCGNLAIEGAAADLLNPGFGKATDELALRARHLDLGGNAAFSSDYVSEMSYRPLDPMDA